MRRMDDFDRTHRNFFRMFSVFWVLTALVSFGTIGFVIYFIVKLMPVILEILHKLSNHL